MNNTISNNSTPNFAPANGNASSAANPASGSRVADSTGTVGQAADNVKLTDSARALQSASKPDEASSIDTKRVDQIRQAIASGHYKIDPQRIADKAMALDQQLGATGKA